MSASGRLAVFGAGWGNESVTLELVPVEILGGADTQGDMAGLSWCPHSTIPVDTCLRPGLS